MLADFIKETISAGGTGNLTLSGAGSGFCTFNAAFGTSRLFAYCIEDGTSREAGFGHLSASTTLVRDTVVETLVSGTYDNTSPTAINASTAAVVFCGAAALTSFASYPAAHTSFTVDGFLPMNMTGSDNNLGSAAAQRCMYWPILIPRAFVLSSIAFNVSISAASCNSEFGIYEINTSGYGGKLLAKTGAVSVAATGMKTTSVTQVFLPAGWYLAACVSDHASNNPQYTATAGCHGNVGNNANTAQVFRWREDTARTTLPDPGGNTSPVYESTSEGPKIFLK